MAKRILAGLVALLLALSGARAGAVVVASKLDTEGGVLGNIILQALNARGIPTVDKTELGATAILRQALLEGQIDIYPEYTGNAAVFFGRQDLPVWKDAAAAYETARSLDLKANDLVWLTPASANNTWAIAVRAEIAEAAGLRTMSEFGRYVAGGGAIKLAASSEFVSAPAALPGLRPDLRLRAQAGPARHPGGRGHRRHDRRGGAEHLRDERRHGVRDRRQPRRRPARGDGRRPRRPAGLPARAGGPGGRPQGPSGRSPPALDPDLPRPRPRHPARPQRPGAARRRAGLLGGGGFSSSGGGFVP